MSSNSGSGRKIVRFSLQVRVLINTSDFSNRTMFANGSDSRLGKYYQFKKIPTSNLTRYLITLNGRLEKIMHRLQTAWTSIIFTHFLLITETLFVSRFPPCAQISHLIFVHFCGHWCKPINFQYIQPPVVIEMCRCASRAFHENEKYLMYNDKKDCDTEMTSLRNNMHRFKTLVENLIENSGINDVILPSRKTHCQNTVLKLHMNLLSETCYQHWNVYKH